MKTLIKNGHVVTAVDTYVADVLIDGSTVAMIGTGLEGVVGTVDTTIDATGKLVIPGGIDPHTHLDLPFGGTSSSDDFETGTRAAAFGGTTTIIDFAVQYHGQSLNQALDVWFAKAEGKAAIDYGFHLICTDLPDHRLPELKGLINQGVSSFKLFMAYPGVFLVDDGTIFKAMTAAGEAGGLICMHAENGVVIDVLVKRALAEGKTAPKYHALTRPTRAEAEGVHRAIAIAEMANAPVYIVHLSCSDALKEVQNGRDLGLPVYAETCPQYLFLDYSYYEQKEFGRDDFTKIPNGGPGVEHRMSLVFDGGVAQRRISLNRFVELTSTAAAKIFGLFPRKGTIAVGSDADIVIFDPNREQTISSGTHHMRVDYSAYEGRSVRGVTETVLSRGNVIVEGGTFKGKAGMGRFLKRGTFA